MNRQEARREARKLGWRGARARRRGHASPEVLMALQEELLRRHRGPARLVLAYYLARQED